MAAARRQAVRNNIPSIRLEHSLRSSALARIHLRAHQETSCEGMDARLRPGHEEKPGGENMTVAARHADITTQDIVCDSGMPAFLAYPAGGGPFPTVILIHERYGLVRHTSDQPMRSARHRFPVLAPTFVCPHSDPPI